MKRRTLIAGSGAVALAAAACTPTQRTSSTSSGRVAGGSTATVMWNQPFYAYNNATSTNNATANANIVYLCNDSVTYYDHDLKIAVNKSFGTYEKVSDSPLTIKVTLADTAVWSDGVPVTAGDILLSFAAQSGSWNTAEKAATDNDGNIVANPEGVVYFDSSSNVLSLITEFPKVEGKVFTYTFSKPYADWEKNILGPGVPAHILAKRALGITDPTKGVEAVVEAFRTKDNAKLAKMANVWNLDWNYVEMPSDLDLVVGCGPYVISEFKKGQYLTVSRNSNYKGQHAVKIDNITIRYNEDPQAAVQALQNREVQLINPQATADILKAVSAIQGVTVLSDPEGTYEHIDLTFNNGGPFDPKTYGGDAEKARKVRQAFLHTVPRGKIVERIIAPLSGGRNLMRNSYETVPGSPMYDAIVAANGVQSTYGNGGDTEKAKALLAEAGVTSPTVRIIYALGNTRRTQEFQLIKESAEAAGFQVVDAASKDWGKKLGDGSYDAALFGWQSTGTAVTSGEANYRVAEGDKAKGSNNKGGYDNVAINRLYDQLLMEVDEAKQQALLIQIEQLLVQDAFGLPIFQFPGITASADTLKGVSKIAISPTIFWNFWEWSL